MVCKASKAHSYSQTRTYIGKKKKSPDSIYWKDQKRETRELFNGRKNQASAFLDRQENTENKMTFSDHRAGFQRKQTGWVLGPSVLAMHCASQTQTESLPDSCCNYMKFAEQIAIFATYSRLSRKGISKSSYPDTDGQYTVVLPTLTGVPSKTPHGHFPWRILKPTQTPVLSSTYVPMIKCNLQTTEEKINTNNKTK